MFGENKDIVIIERVLVLVYCFVLIKVKKYRFGLFFLCCIIFVKLVIKRFLGNVLENIVWFKFVFLFVTNKEARIKVM